MLDTTVMKIEMESQLVSTWGEPDSPQKLVKIEVEVN